MTERTNATDNNEVVSVRDRLKRRGLKPRSKEELDMRVLGHVNEFALSDLDCEDCNVERLPSLPFKPNDSNSIYKTWTCPTCGDVLYEEVVSRSIR